MGIAKYNEFEVVAKYGYREKIINITKPGTAINVKNELGLDENIADIFPIEFGKYKLSINNKDSFLKWEKL